MRKTRIFYDLFSVILVLAWIFVFLSKSVFGIALKRGVLIETIGIIFISAAYTISVIGLVIYLAKRNQGGKEMPFLIFIIVGCLIIPIVGPILFYLFAIRKATKTAGQVQNSPNPQIQQNTSVIQNNNL